MAFLIRMPQPGSTMEEGTIVRWLVDEGDYVEEGQPVLEIETDKATIEVESEAAGIVKALIARPGEVIPVRSPIAVLGDDEEQIDLSALLDGWKASVEHPVEAVVNVQASPRAQRIASELNVPLSKLAGKGTGPEGRIIERDVRAYAERQAETTVEAPEEVKRLPEAIVEPSIRTTPLAAKVAESLGVDLEDLSLGLPGSRLRKEDVILRAEAAEVVIEEKPAPPETNSRIPFNGLRKRTAEAVTKSATSIPQVTLTLEVDMTECERFRNSLREEFAARFGAKITATCFIVRALGIALREHPLLNSSLAENEIVLHEAINLGIAVAMPDGLLVPTLKSADKMSLPEIGQALQALADRARANLVTPDDLGGGTFTLTNLGAYGIESFNPIVVPGQAAILGTGAILEKPAVYEGRVEVRSVMMLCLSFDHRIPRWRAGRSIPCACESFA